MVNQLIARISGWLGFSPDDVVPGGALVKRRLLLFRAAASSNHILRVLDFYKRSAKPTALDKIKVRNFYVSSWLIFFANNPFYFPSTVCELSHSHFGMPIYTTYRSVLYVQWHAYTSSGGACTK